MISIRRAGLVLTSLVVAACEPPVGPLSSEGPGLEPDGSLAPFAAATSAVIASATGSAHRIRSENDQLDPSPTTELLGEPGVRIFDIANRPMNGWLIVAAQVLRDEGLARWVERGITHARSLP